MEGRYRLRCSLRGHEKDVRCVSPSLFPNGGILSGSRDATCRIWSPNEFDNGFMEGNLMSGHSGYVTSVCALPPTEEYPHGLIATGSHDSTINVYCLDSPVALYKLEGHTGAVCSLASGQQGTLLSGSWDKTAKVWVNKRCVMTLEGHEMAVWAVALLLEKGMMVTGSADRTVRLWLNGHCIQVLTGHSDCVRGLTVLSDHEIVSASNDATLRLWSVAEKGTSTCLAVFYGHTNFVYNVAVLPPGSLGDFASVGEDRSLRVWKKGSSSAVQTIFHPATSVWCVCALSNGDIVTGSSDTVVRVFTANSQRMAADEDMQAYDKLVAATAVSQQIGDLKPDELPGPEFLNTKGPSDGFVQLIREGTSITCYQWDGGENRWKKVGEVVGSSGATAATSGKMLHAGKEYDYVFTIDAKEGAPPLKLPYNLTEDPWFAAQKFIGDNNLSQSFLEEIANFIINNTKGATFSQISANDSSSTDPFTGSGRYIPGSDSSRMAPAGSDSMADPFTGGSRYNPAASNIQSSKESGGFSKNALEPARKTQASSQDRNVHFPQIDYVVLGQANVPAILGKIKDFGAAPDSCLSAAEYQLLEMLAAGVGGQLQSPIPNGERQYELLWNLILQWPHDKVYPLLDMLRLVIRYLEASAYFYGGFQADSFLKHLLAMSQHGFGSIANQMLGLRTLCNSFSQLSGRIVLERRLEEVLAACTSQNVMTADNKNVMVAVSTVLLNYAVMMRPRGGQASSGGAEAALPSADHPQAVLNAVAACTRHQTGSMHDPEVQYRLLVCLGTLIWENDFCIALAASMSEIGSFVLACCTSSTAKVQQCATALKCLLIDGSS